MSKDKTMEYIQAYVYNVDDEGLNVRSGPGTNYKILTVIHFGTAVYQTKFENGWTRIYSGLKGEYWVSSKYLTETKPTNIYKVKGADSEGLNVRNSASTSGKLLNTIKNGTTVGVFNLNGNSVPTWAKVGPSSSRYCYGKYLTKVEYPDDFDPEPGIPIE